MRYETRYLAFLDILGFSSFVRDEQNIKSVQTLFSFASRFCHLYNNTPPLEAKASFFSDSIVIAASSLGTLFTAIGIAERAVRDNLGLLTRGGICKGSVLLADGMLFGPAVITAHDLESRAGYSRVLIDNSVTDELSIDEYLDFYTDVDGCVCLNPYAKCIHDKTEFGPEGHSYPTGDPSDAIVSIYASEGEILEESIRKYRGSSVVEKYLWRTRPFNYTCNSLANEPRLVPMLQDTEYVDDGSFAQRIRGCQIQNAF